MKAHVWKLKSVREPVHLYTSSYPFTCFQLLLLSVKLIMDYSGGQKVLPVFFHKKRVGWKRLGGKNGGMGSRVDGSSIEKIVCLL